MARNGPSAEAVQMDHFCGSPSHHPVIELVSVRSSNPRAIPFTCP